MAKYVLVEFANNDEAEAFASTIADAGEASSLTVRAIFQKPTQYCECPPSDKSVRGKKYGWWVHKVCGKPKRGQWQHPRNLLDPQDLKPKERTIYLGVVEGGKPYAGQTPEVPVL